MGGEFFVLICWHVMSCIGTYYSQMVGMESFSFCVLVVVGHGWGAGKEISFLPLLLPAGMYLKYCFFLSEDFSLSFCSKYHSLAMTIVLCKVSVGLILFIAVLYS